MSRGSIAASTSANGFLLGPVGLLVLLLRRAYARSLVVCQFRLAARRLSYHYTWSVQQPMFRLYYITRPLFFLAFFGCVIPFRWYAAYLGLALLSIVCWRGALASIAGIRPRSIPLYGFWPLEHWSGGCGERSPSAPLRGTAFYSVLMVIFCYSYLAEYLPSRWPGFNRKVST